MAKNTCKICGKPSLREYCWLHKAGGGIRHSPPRKLVVSKETEEGLEAAESDEMWTFFMKIWNSRPHYCRETRQWLGKEPKRTMFHHLLWKSSYPEYQYEDWNIILLYPDIHENAHQNLDSTPTVKQLTEAAWQRHISR